MNDIRNHRNRMLQRYLKVAIAVLSLSSLPAFSATLVSSVDRNMIGLNDTVQLQINYDNQISSDALNFSVLQTDFEVLGVSPQSSSNIAMVNGKVTRVASTNWRITLAPKRLGTLRIPEFAIGGARSRAIGITVDKMAPGARNQPLTVTASSDKRSAFVEEQILIRIQIHAELNVSNLGGAPLQLENADIQVLEQQTEQRIVQGIAQQRIVLSYLVFPKTAGSLVIPAQTFTGNIGGQRSIFDSFQQRGQQIVARTPPIRINIKEAPNGDGESWFPAANVNVSSSWSGDKSSVTVGEPITRTIKITAFGQRANVIPPLNSGEGAKSQSHKVYQDQPQLENTASSNSLIGNRTEAQAIVAAVPGNLVLPEQRVKWWSTEKNQWQEVVLPEETLSVSAAVVEGIFNDTSPLSSAAETGNTRELVTATFSPWKLATLVLAVLCGALLFMVLRLQTQIKTDVADDVANSSAGESKAWSDLRSSFKQQDSSCLRRQLLQWANSILPDIGNVSLQNLGRYCTDPVLQSELEQEFSQLDEYLYKGGDNFDPKALAGLLPRLRQHLKQQASLSSLDTGELAPLYPK